jgi:hypothetical protein
MSLATNQMNTSAHVARSNYSPVDAINRHDFGVQKNRKQASPNSSPENALQTYCRSPEKD